MGWPLDPSVLPAFLAAMVLVELTPGPNMTYLAALSAHRGRAAGFAAVAGVTGGLAVYLAAALLGVTELLLVWPAAYEILRWSGVLLMLWLAFEAWRGAESAPGQVSDGAAGRLGLFWRGFLANILNPKAALFYVALLPGFVREGFGPAGLQILLLGLGHLLISLVVHSLIVLGAARAGALMGAFEPGARYSLVRKGLAIAIGLVAIWLAWETRRA